MISALILSGVLAAQKPSCVDVIRGALNVEQRADFDRTNIPEVLRAAGLDDGETLYPLVAMLQGGRAQISFRQREATPYRNGDRVVYAPAYFKIETPYPDEPYLHLYFGTDQSVYRMSIVEAKPLDWRTKSWVQTSENTRKRERAMIALNPLKEGEWGHAIVRYEDRPVDYLALYGTVYYQVLDGRIVLDSRILSVQVNPQSGIASVYQASSNSTPIIRKPYDASEWDRIKSQFAERIAEKFPIGVYDITPPMRVYAYPSRRSRERLVPLWFCRITARSPSPPWGDLIRSDDVAYFNPETLEVAFDQRTQAKQRGAYIEPGYYRFRDAVGFCTPAHDWSTSGPSARIVLMNEKHIVVAEYFLDLGILSVGEMKSRPEPTLRAAIVAGLQP